MENKVGKNVSSGAEKVEKVEKISQEKVDPAPAATKKTAKTTAKKRTPAARKGEKKERAAAKKRVEAAKTKAEKKEEKVQHKLELKQKKLEKKAALKQKKLDRKALIAKKREERRQKRLEKKAALKEKKLERRAEKIARREMLRNESKAERQKRIEREKRDRVALKRQRREARVKAREDKMKSREQARERRASDRKHKREQKTQRKENRRGFGGWLAAVISLGVACLALATIVTAGAFRMNDMSVEAEGGARATLYELVSVSEDMDGSLSKLRVSAGAEEQRKLLTDILVDAALLEATLQRVPVDGVTGTDISGFLNKTNTAARGMLKKLAAGEALSAQEKEELVSLYETNAKISSELNSLVNEMSDGDLRDFMAGKDGTMSESFMKLGKQSRGKEEISEAPFSDEGNVGENKLARYEEITREQAQKACEKYFEAYHVAEINYTGETAAVGVTCYNFRLTDENGVEIFAEITKNGGKLAFFDTYEECSTKNFDLETCDAIATEYLRGIGIENTEAVWLSDGGMVANLTYVSIEDGVRVYPEIIRVRVCEEKGRVIGIDARGYLLNEGERKFHAELSETEAKAKLSDGLEVTGVNRAIIPVDGKETNCYEFACTFGEEEYLVYLDAVTGDEVELFRVRQSARGSYLE